MNAQESGSLRAAPVEPESLPSSRSMWPDHCAHRRPASQRHPRDQNQVPECSPGISRAPLVPQPPQAWRQSPTAGQPRHLTAQTPHMCLFSSQTTPRPLLPRYFGGKTTCFFLPAPSSAQLHQAPLRPCLQPPEACGSISHSPGWAPAWFRVHS